MKRETTTCIVCDKPFAYFRYNKPRAFCSWSCEHQRDLELQRLRRARKRGLPMDTKTYTEAG